MKKLKLFILVGAGILFTSLFFTSCLDDNDYSLDKFWMEVVTISPSGDNSFYLRTDKGITLLPVTSTYYNPKKEQRALVNYTLLSDSIYGFDHAIKVNSIDTILTKQIAENLNMQNDSVYGKDPVSVKDLWIGDGYLNLYFGAYYGNRKLHFVNLVEQEEEKPYHLVFRHNAYDDPKEVFQLGVVAFDLSTLPDTEGKTVDLILSVKTFEGDKTYTLKYNSNKKEYTTPASLDNLMLENKLDIKYLK